MKKLLTILICLLPFFSKAQTANAGNDTTIYLTLGNTATLNGAASSATTYQWTEVSTDYMSGATISNSTSKVATVSGLPQGVFYFQIAATTGGTTHVDTMKVNVNLSVGPGTLLRSMAQTAFPNIAFQDTVNTRRDTVNTLDQEVYPITFPDGLSNQVFLDRNRTNDEWIDGQAGKFYSQVEDGYKWFGNPYGRAEMSFGTGYTIDTSKTYCMEWKGYYPQDFSTLTLNQTVAIMMQVHADSSAQSNYGTQMINTGSGTQFIIDSINKHFVVCGLDSFVNKTHTVRVTFKESSVGGFYKVEVDGVQKVYIAGGWGGLPRGKDYPKIATVYDYDTSLVSPTNLARGRKWKQVTEDFNIYDVSIPTAAPTISMSGNQSITTSSTTVSATATWAAGHTGVYSWTIVSGGSGTFSSPNSSSTNISGLSNGTYDLRCTATQDDGQQVHGDVTVTVNLSVAAPTVSVSNQSISTLTTSITATATFASGHSGTYLWTQTSGAATTLSNTATATLGVSGLRNGTYQFKCTVTQDDSQTANATSTVTVTIAAPTANAGSNQTITLPTNTTTLSGSATSASGHTITYNWTGTGLSGATTLTPTVTVTTAGTYTYTLTVTQDDGQTATSSMTVTVNNATNSQKWIHAKGRVFINHD